MRKEQSINSLRSTNASASAIILPGGSIDDALIQIVQKWTKSWLLRPAFWISVKHIIRTEGETPKILATVIGRDGRQDVDFLQYLSRLSLNSINIVAVRVVESDEPFNRDQDEIIDLVAEYVEKSKPTLVNFEKESNPLKLFRVNLVFAPSERRGASAKELYEPNWEANLVVAAEDRRTPNSMDGFLRYSEKSRLHSFMLSNIASAAGIWSGQKKGIFEITADQSDLSPMHGLVRLMRVFVRGIISEGLSIRVGAEALNRASKSETSIIQGRAFQNRQLVALEGESIERQIDSMVETTFDLENGELDYVENSFKMDYEMGEIGVKGAIKNFYKSSIALVKVLPIWIFASLWNGIARLVTLKLFGSRGQLKVKGTIDFPKTELDVKANMTIQEIENGRNQIKEEFSNWPKNVMRRPAPGLWKAFRSLILGNLDGSQLPNGIAQQRDDYGATRVIGELNLVIPNLNEVWELPSHLENDANQRRSTTWLDKNGIEEISLYLQDKLTATKKEAETISQALEDLEERQNELELKLVRVNQSEETGSNG